MKGKTIVFCPLDWGLGHATRCVPIIQALTDAGAHIIIAADKGPALILKELFPLARHIPFPGLTIRYPEKGNMALFMARTFPKLIQQTGLERKFIQELVQKEKVDLVFSDNRYGVYTDLCPCIFMSHQLFIRGTQNTQFMEPLIRKITWSYIRKFDACWVPDFEIAPGMAGNLSHGNYYPHRQMLFTGPLSRFSCVQAEKPDFEFPDILVLLSGPEPLRTQLEVKLMHQLTELNLQALIVQGLPHKGQTLSRNGSIWECPHLPSAQLKYCIQNAKMIISRSGYSTVMDLIYLKQKAIFIPTPGQTEQEYLAKLYLQQKWFFSMPQNEFSVKHSSKEFENFSFPETPNFEIDFANEMNKIYSLYRAKNE